MMLDKLYTVIFQDNDKVIIDLCDANHPIFKAHFPSEPILPGFIHFEIVSTLFNIDIQTIKKAKFTKIIRPMDRLEYLRKNNKFEVFCTTDLVASFVL